MLENPLIFGVVAVILLVIVLKLFLGGSKSPLGGNRDTVLLLGSANAGKTALFHRLRDGKFVDTVTSMKERMEKVKISSSVTESNPDEDVETITKTILDFPGHDRLRTRLQDFYPIASSILFLLDGSEGQHMRSTSELLYDIFTHPKIHDANLSMLIACNKSDVPSFQSTEKIKRVLEKELSQLKTTRSSLEAEADEEERDNLVPLGREGQSFEFEIDAPCEVSFVKCSVNNNDVEEVVEFLKQS